MRILLIGIHNHPLVEQFALELRKNLDVPITIEIISRKPKSMFNTEAFDNVHWLYQENSKEMWNDIKAFKRLRTILNGAKQYDICHIHFTDYKYALIANLIKKKCRKLICTIWGSDYYRIGYIQKKILAYLLSHADYISFSNKRTREELIDELGFSLHQQKMTVVRYGLGLLHNIELLKRDREEIRKTFNISHQTIVITCGYNADQSQQHIAMLEAINTLDQKQKSNILLFLPLTYGGNQEYTNQIKTKLKQINTNFQVFTEFLSDDNLAKLRLVSDIMIQIQKTDQFSGSMQEHMYAGDLIITGDWLPYETMKERGAFFLEISHTNNLSKELSNILSNFDTYKKKCEINEEAIKGLSHWNVSIEDWLKLYGIKPINA